MDSKGRQLDGRSMQSKGPGGYAEQNKLHAACSRDASLISTRANVYTNRVHMPWAVPGGSWLVVQLCILAVHKLVSFLGKWKQVEISSEGGSIVFRQLHLKGIRVFKVGRRLTLKSGKSRTVKMR